MKTGQNLLVLMIVASILALVPKRLLQRRRQSGAPLPVRTKPLKNPGSRMVWTAEDEAEWGSGSSKK